ncbi:hypothetical protein DFA_03962 [Cavenderia fasciculata]|uniref:TMEM131L fifth Ig-like domain-containing protein n=1 Tax=Cavenderia fasciculata TaxID=261658 RepID=F4Q0W7_CACFS|nr:uncharacterized protein DFA_03962 [Cavenderia fasciculata]EGG18468.1 hypothetical protein DFA_03962 [Cavenderia fasciculata]|eukprot:XP_004366372.1 hypothetical protein DFA_03962 [Cavenderia fasciculata]
MRGGSLDVPANVAIHTDIVSHHAIKTSATLAKPNLFSSKDVNVDELRYPDPDVPAGAAFVAALALDFGMARINADVYRTVDIYNPLDIPIFAQLFDLDLESLVANYKIKHGIDKLENTNNCMDGEASTDDDEDKDGDNINNDSSDFIKRQQSHFHPLVLKKTKDQHSIYFDDIDKPAAQQAAGKQPSSSSSGRNKIFSLKRSGAENMMFIAPKSTVAFGPIKFHPLNYTSYNAIVYLKNNYTYLQPIFLTGHGGGGRLLVVDSDTHMSNSILLDLNKTHLSPCIFQRHNVEVDINSDILIDSKKVVNSQNTNRIEVSKSFTIVNTGNLILEIKDIFINDFKCNGFGFKVLNCNELKGLSINEGEMFKIQVSYEPDFSTSMLKKELVIKTNQESFGFNLIGTFPHEFLPLCTHLQPSFFYDYPAKVIFILSMVILFFMLILLSFIKPVGHKRKSLLQRIVARITATRIRWSTSVTTASLTAASGRELLTSGGGGVDSPTSSYHHGGSRDNHNHHHHISASVIPKSPDKSSSSSNEKNNNKTTVNKKERLTNRKIKSSNEDNSNSSRKNSSSSKSLNHNHHHHQQHQVMTTTTTTTTVLEEDKFEDSIVIQQQQEKEKDLLLAARSPLSESLDDISMSSHDNLGAILEDGVDNPTTPTEDLTPRSIDDEPTTTIVQQDHVEKIDASTITSTMTTKTTTIVISSTSLEDVVSNNNDKSKNEQQQHQQPSTSVVVVETIKQKHQQQKEDKPLLVVQADKKVAEVVVPSIQTVTSTTAPPSSASSKPQQKKKNTKHQQQQQQQQSLKISSDQSNDENVNTNKTNNHNHNGVNLNLSSSGSGSNIPIVASSSSSSTTDSSLTSTTPAYFGKKKYHKDNNSSAFLPANPPPPGSAKPVREPKKKYEKPQKQTTGKVVYVPKVPQPTTQPTTQQPPISTPTLQQPLPYSQQQQQQQNSVYLQYLQQQQQQQQKLQLQLQQQQQQQQSYSPFSNNGQFDYNPFISTSPPPQSTSSSSTSSNPSLLNTYNPFSFSPRPSTNNNNNTTTTTSPTSTSTSTLIQPSWFTNMNNLLAVDSSNNQQQQQQVMKSNTSPSHHQYHNNSLWRDQFGVIGSGKVSTTTSPNHTNNNSSSDLLMSSSATPSYRDLMPNTNLTSFLQQHSTVGTNTPINNNNNNSNNTSTTMTAGGVNPTTTTTTTVTNNNTTSGVYSPSYDLFANQMFGFSQPSSTQTTPTSVPSIANISTLTKFNLNHGYENGDDNDQQQQ